MHLAKSFQGKKSVKYVSFHESEQKISIYIQEILDPSYGCYIWPSALVMADYVWYFKDRFVNQRILEIGSGTALPTLLLAKTVPSARIIQTDLPDILPVTRSCLALNSLQENVNSLWVRGLIWGDIDGTNTSVASLIQQVEASWTKPIQYILGSDTFYDPADFEKILMTVSFVIHHHNPTCEFITAYQERSSKRSLQYLLDKWSLQCEIISRDAFNFDPTRFIQDTHKGMTQHVKLDPSALASVFMLKISKKNT